MNKTVATILKPIIFSLKRYIDKLYFRIYNVSGRESMIRNMFPWHENINDYSYLSSYIANNDFSEITTIRKLLMSFYWNEVAELLSNGNVNEVAKYEGILKFVDLVSTYKEYSISITNS